MFGQREESWLEPVCVFLLLQGTGSGAEYSQPILIPTLQPFLAEVHPTSPQIPKILGSGGFFTLLLQVYCSYPWKGDSV